MRDCPLASITHAPVPEYWERQDGSNASPPAWDPDEENSTPVIATKGVPVSGVSESTTAAPTCGFQPLGMVLGKSAEMSAIVAQGPGAYALAVVQSVLADTLMAFPNVLSNVC